MKLSHALAATAAGFAVLTSVGNAPANAAGFQLSGRFASTSSGSGIVTQLENGSFDGTYSFSGQASPSSPLLSFLINLRDASNNIVTTFNSAVPFETGTIAYSNNINSLTFSNGTSAGLTMLNVLFSGNSPGVGVGNTGGYLRLEYGQTFQIGGIGITSVTSTPVPEPLTVGGTMIAAGVGVALKKKAAAQKVGQKA
jgi:hypothetical protein